MRITSISSLHWSQALIVMTMFLFRQLAAVELDLTSMESVCDAAKAVAEGELNYYQGTKRGGTLGMFSLPYYWWHAGEAFAGLIDYYHFCQLDNDTLQELILTGMYHQAGEEYNYIPSNQSLTEGNDDQGIWGMAIMQAAERNLTNPSEDHSWISLTQAVFNTMNARWDDQHCGGGLRWQIFTWNSGYDYKNTISNGILFNLAARLGRYLDNETYFEIAEKTWNWLTDVGFYTQEEGNLVVYDGAKIPDCQEDITKLRWSYNYGVLLSGCAYIYNATEDEVWKERSMATIEAAISYFQTDQVMAEVTCSTADRCNEDQRSFRSLFARSLALTSVLIPETQSLMGEFLARSAQGAAQSCSGGSDGVTCGHDWHVNGWDEKFGLGEQMSALLVILANVYPQFAPPLTVETGASNDTDYQAGMDTPDHENQNKLNIETKDKAGAAVLTAVVLVLALAGGVWMIF